MHKAIFGFRIILCPVTQIITANSLTQTGFLQLAHNGSGPDLILTLCSGLTELSRVLTNLVLSYFAAIVSGYFPGTVSACFPGKPSPEKGSLQAPFLL